MSKKRSAIDAEMRKAYAELSQERPNICAGCGSPQFEHSHSYPKRPFSWLIANKKNIVKYCRECHRAFEDNRFWVLDNWKEVLTWMYELAGAEFDVIRKKMMLDSLRSRLMKCGDFKEGKPILGELSDFLDNQ